jgi:MFS family permease
MLAPHETAVHTQGVPKLLPSPPSAPASPETPKGAPSPNGDGSVSGIQALRQLGPHAGLFALLCIATFFEGFDTKLASLVQPVIGNEFGASTEELGTALGLSSLGMSLAFFVILLADVVGRRPIFLGALLAYALLTLATAFSPDLIVFTGLQLFARMAMVVELSLAYLILSEEIPGKIRGRVNGLFASTAALGAAIPDALLAPLNDAGIGWRGLFLIGSLPLFLFPIYVYKIRETRAFLERPTTTGKYGAEFRAAARALWSSLYRGRLVRLTGIWLAINFWSGTALYFFTLYTFSERGWEASDLQRLPWGTIPFGLAGYILSGFAMDRLGRRTATTGYLICAFFATIFCYGSTGNAWIYLGMFFLTGLTGVWTIATTWTTELFPTQTRATALGISNNLIGRLGLVFGPIVAGRLSAALGSTSLAISILAGVTLLVIPLVWSLPETNGADLFEEESA